MKLVKIIKVLFVFAIGGIFGFITNNWSFFAFDNKIVVVDLLNLIATLGLGYYIATSLQKKQGSNRVEKDLLIEEIKKIKADLEKISSFVENNNAPFSETVGLFKSISQNLSSITELVEICKIKGDCGLDKLQPEITSIKRLVTNSPSQNNQFDIANDNKVQAQNLLFKLRSSLFQAIIAINRHDHN